MKSQHVGGKEPVPPEHLAEAGVWIARLHGDQRDRALEAGFRKWLRADPLNARAFELTTEVWEDSLNLRRVVPFAHHVPQAAAGRHRFAVPVLAVAAALATVAVGLFYSRDPSMATGIGEQRLLTLEDGTRVHLNTDTRVVVEFTARQRKVSLKSGEALFDVAKQADRPFVVEAGERQVEALGTTFSVRYEPEQTAVTLLEGKVAVTSRAESATKPVVMAPGQRLTFAASTGAKLDQPALEKTMAWRQGQVILDDMPLSGAIHEMNRYNGTRLVIRHAEAANLLVNGLFQAGDSMNFANAVAETYGLRVVRKEGEIVLDGLPQPVARPLR